jgi:hypothetical protein
MFVGAYHRRVSCHPLWIVLLLVLLLVLTEATAGFVGVAKGSVSTCSPGQQLSTPILATHFCSPTTGASIGSFTLMSHHSEDLEPVRKKNKRQTIVQQGKQISLQLERRKEELDQKARRVAKDAAAKKLLVLEEKIQNLKQVAERVYKKEEEIYAKLKDRNKASNILAAAANLVFWRRNRMNRKTASQAASDIVAATVKASMKEKEKLNIIIHQEAQKYESD